MQVTAHVAWGDIVLDPLYQVRPDGLDDAHAQALAVSLEADEHGELADLDPVDLVRFPDGTLKLVHGWHRHRAYQIAGRAEIPAHIHDGDHDLALELAGIGNVKNGRPFGVAARLLVLRRWMESSGPLSRMSFAAYKRKLGLRADAIAAAWVELYGPGPREYVGQDGKTYTQVVGGGTRLPRPAAAPALPTDDDGGDDDENVFAGGVDSPAVVTIGGGSAPVATRATVGAPQPISRNGSAPSVTVNLPGAPQPGSGVSPSHVMLRRPPTPHPLQTLVNMSVTWELADGSEGQASIDGEGGMTGISKMTNSVLLGLIAVLNERLGV